MDKLKELITTTEMLLDKQKRHIKEGQKIEKETRGHLKELLKWASEQ